MHNFEGFDNRFLIQTWFFLKQSKFCILSLSPKFVAAKTLLRNGQHSQKTTFSNETRDLKHSDKTAADIVCRA